MRAGDWKAGAEDIAGRHLPTRDAAAWLGKRQDLNDVRGPVRYELATGGTVFVQRMAPGVVLVPEAHLVGAAAGLLAGWLPARKGRAVGAASAEQHAVPSAA